MNCSSTFFVSAGLVAACAATHQDQRPLPPAVAPSEAPAPSARIPVLDSWARQDLYQIEASALPGLHGTIAILEDAEGATQNRLSLKMGSAVIRDRVIETRKRAGRLQAFRLLQREADNDLEITGTMEGNILVVRRGEDKYSVPWSEKRRFVAPTPADFLATSMKRGRFFVLEIYDPVRDPGHCLTRSYVMGEPAVYVTPLGDRIPAHHVEVDVPVGDGRERLRDLLVDRQGRVLRTIQMPSRASLNRNGVVVSLLETSTGP